MKATHIKEVTVIDPETNQPVEVSIYKEEAGGMFGVDTSYLSNTDEDVISPFGNGIIEFEESEWEPSDPETRVFRAMEGGTDGG